MTPNQLAFIGLIAPLIFVGVAVASWFQPGMRPPLVKQLALWSSAFALFTAALSGFFVAQYGLLETDLIGMNGLGFSLRLDTLSVLMAAMIAIIGFVVVKFSLNYLDGDARQGAFLGRLAATLAAVHLLVLAGNLALLLVAWVLTSISLHRLLLFYPERRGAQIAARKKFIIARLSDLFLLGAAVGLYSAFGTGHLETIFQALAQGATGLEWIAVLLVLAALFKSAQFPTHGWLIEVMETPTPVSALLHAGLLNAGPFLMVRMAYLLEASHSAGWLLITVGGLTALFGSVVYLTQNSIKTALSYSSVGHMGFSLLLCGLGAYPAAMLHLVAHSFYKAHAFLSSGSVVESLRVYKASPKPGPMKVPSLLAGAVVSLLIYVAFAKWWGVDLQNNPGLWVIGLVVVMGLARLLGTVLYPQAGVPMILRTLSLTVLVALAFFTFEGAMHQLIGSQIPMAGPLTTTELLIAGLLVVIFASTVVLQVKSASWMQTPIGQAWLVHLRNGLYVNACFDRLVGTWRLSAIPRLKASTTGSRSLSSTTIDFDWKQQSA